MHPDGMGWSWPDLDATPVYVRQFCWDFLRRQRAAALARSEKSQREAASAADGKIRIER
jgi:hypothetical protein